MHLSWTARIRISFREQEWLIAELSFFWENNIFSVHWITQNSPRDIYIYALGTISLLEFDSVVIDNIDNLKYNGKQISAVELISVLIKKS